MTATLNGWIPWKWIDVVVEVDVDIDLDLDDSENERESETQHNANRTILGGSNVDDFVVDDPEAAQPPTSKRKRDTDTDSTVEVSTRVRTALAEVDDVEDVRQKLDLGLSAEAGPLPGAIHTTIPRAIFSGEEPTEESSHYSPAIEPPIEVPFATMPDAVWPELAVEPPKEASYDLVSLSDALSARLHGEEEALPMVRPCAPTTPLRRSALVGECLAALRSDASHPTRSRSTPWSR